MDLWSGGIRDEWMDECLACFSEILPSFLVDLHLSSSFEATTTSSYWPGCLKQEVKKQKDSSFLDMFYKYYYSLIQAYYNVSS